jgi:hypothetical protein
MATTASLHLVGIESNFDHHIVRYQQKELLFDGDGLRSLIRED